MKTFLRTWGLVCWVCLVGHISLAQAPDNPPQDKKLRNARLRLQELTKPGTTLTSEEARQLVALFKAAGLEAEMMKWVRNEVEPFANSTNRLQLVWLVEDLETFTEIQRETHRSKLEPRSFHEWWRRIATDRPRWMPPFIEALAAQLPQEPWLRFERLATNLPLTPKDIPVLETLLNRPQLERKSWLEYPGGDLRTPHELAYRLMRLYAEAGKTREIFELAGKIAQARDLFRPQGNLNDVNNEATHYANVALAVASGALKDPVERVQLLELLQKSPWKIAETQLRRVLEPNRAASPRPATVWVNLPKGVTALASTDNVLSLCRDASHLYTGHPWGVSIQSFDGKSAVNFALGAEVHCLARLGEDLWAGTSLGLYRISLKTRKTAHLWCDQEFTAAQKEEAYADFQISNGQRQSKRSLREELNTVTGLAVQGDTLWIGGFHTIRTLDVKTNRMRIFRSGGELQGGSPFGWHRFLFDGPYVWADDGIRCLRFNPAAQAWESPDAGPKNPVSLLDLIDGELWGNIHFPDRREYQLCRIDRRTLSVQPVGYQKPLGSWEDVREPFGFVGRYEGNPVFRRAAYPNSHSDRFAFEPAAGLLNRLPDSKTKIVPAVPDGLHLGVLYRNPDGTWVTKPTGSYKRWITSLPDGTQLVTDGRWIPSTYRTTFDFEWPFQFNPIPYPNLPAGVRTLSPERTGQPSSLEFRTVSIPGDAVFAAVPDERTGNIWLCTAHGIGLVTKNFHLLEVFGRRDGLDTERITSGVAVNGKFYFAGGDTPLAGITVFDPATRIFTTLDRFDGLAAAPVAALSLNESGITVAYEPVQRGNTFVSFMPGQLDPIRNVCSPSEWTPIDLQKRMDLAERRPRDQREPMPLLGGLILDKREISRKTFLFGTRGLLVVTGKTPLSGTDFPELTPTVQPGDWKLRQEAEAVKIDLTGGLEALRTYVQHPNPYVVANALSEAHEVIKKEVEPAWELVAGCLRHPHPRVRGTAIWQLYQVKKLDLVKYIQPIINDPVREIRLAATLALARSGKKVELRQFEEILKGPFQMRIGLGVWVPSPATPAEVYKLLSAQATPEILTLLRRYPDTANFDLDETIWRNLGQAVAAHPEIIPQLLEMVPVAADDTREPNRKWIRRVFKYAGPTVLPALERGALWANPEVRSNSALACGAVGDPAAIPYLAGELEAKENLIKDAAILALGEIRTPESLGLLVGMYLESLSFHFNQVKPENRGQRQEAGRRSFAQYLAEMTAFGKSVNAPEINSRDWTNPHLILESVSRFDPCQTQGFYRVLCHNPDPLFREAAARSLGQCIHQEFELNRRSLRELLEDDSRGVRIHAALSLLLLGDTGGTAILAEVLAEENSPYYFYQKEVLKTLSDKVKDPAKLRFACAALTKIAPSLVNRDSEREQVVRHLLKTADCGAPR